MLGLALSTNRIGFAPPNVIRYLLVGGGGGTALDGAGGAGGLIQGQIEIGNFPIGSYPITVGLAGLNSPTPQNGGSTTFNGMTAVGGGAAGYNPGGNGSSGGSGGGGSSGGSGGSGTAGQGYAGGNNNGGGGGAAGPGVSNLGAGGPGVTSSISGSAVLFARGGNAGAVPNPLSAANTGHGASWNSSTIYNATDGVVLLSYKTGSMVATGGSISTSGDQTIHRFTVDDTFIRTA